MTKRNTQYKPRAHLSADSNKLFAEVDAFHKRDRAWKRLLSDAPSERTIGTVAALLARYGYEPDETGIPKGPEWPPAVKANPLVYLNDLMPCTLAYKADVLKAATLVWAGVIKLDDEEIRAACPLAQKIDVVLLLEWCDFAAYWRRPGVGLTAEQIRARYEQGEFDIDRRQLAGSLRRARGGTKAR